MKKVWFGAAAFAALSLSAFGAQARDEHPCVDDACVVQSLLPSIAASAFEGVSREVSRKR